MLEVGVTLEAELVLGVPETLREAEAALLELALVATLDTAEDATLGVEAALVVLDATASLLLTRTFAALVEDELALAVLPAATDETILDVGAVFELPLAVLLRTTEDEELALAVLDAAEETNIEELALAVLDTTEEARLGTTVEELALAVLDTAEEATLGLEGVILGDEAALNVLETAAEPTLELEGAALEDEPALIELEAAEEATMELDDGMTTEDVPD